VISVLLIVHGLLAVGLLGAITHQAFSVARARATVPHTFIGRFSAVGAAHYTNAIVVLFVVTTIGGALLYPQYRLDIRTTLEDLNLREANGAFEIKEHLGAIGLGILPIYWFLWKRMPSDDFGQSRKYLTWLLAFIVWWNFLVGHVLNNIKGFGG
jgi:hypothetical protein